MTDGLVVRLACDADLPAITAIYAWHVLSGTGTFETEPPDEPEMARRFAAIRDRGQPWLVAERDDVVLGYAYAGPFRLRPAYDWAVEDSIYLRPEAMRRGVGSALLAGLLERCTAAGYRQMIALIGDSANAGSIALHRRFGFTETGRMPSVGWKHGRWLDVVLMQRPLGTGDAEPAGERPRQVP